MIQTCAESMRLQLERRNTAVAARWWWRQRHRDSSHVCDSALQGGRCVQTVDNRRDTCNVSRPCGYGGDATAHPTEQTSSHSPTTYMWMASHLDNKTNHSKFTNKKMQWLSWLCVSSAHWKSGPIQPGPDLGLQIRPGLEPNVLEPVSYTHLTLPTILRV